MQPINRFLILCLLAFPLLGACGSTPVGPQAWIDIPLDDMTLPLEMLHIIAHASDAEGVGSFEFYVNEQNILSAATSEHKRLESMEIEWTPPGPGTYLIGVRGINSSGTAGAMATSRLTISGTVTLTPATVMITATGMQIASETKTVTVTLTRTTTNTSVTPPPPAVPTVTAKMDANCREGPGTAYAVYGNLLAGQEAMIKGRLADNSWLLITLAGRSRNCWIAAPMVNVSGDLNLIESVAAPAAPPAKVETPPTVEVLLPEPIIIDNTPPGFQEGHQPEHVCITSPQGGGAKTVKSVVIASDESGIGSVTAYWTFAATSGNNLSGYATYYLVTTGWHPYEYEFGPFDEAGTLQVNGTITDIPGNSSYFSFTVVYQVC